MQKLSFTLLVIFMMGSFLLIPFPSKIQGQEAKKSPSDLLKEENHQLKEKLAKLKAMIEEATEVCKTCLGRGKRCRGFHKCFYAFKPSATSGCSQETTCWTCKGLGRVSKVERLEREKKNLSETLSLYKPLAVMALKPCNSCGGRGSLCRGKHVCSGGIGGCKNQISCDKCKGQGFFLNREALKHAEIKPCSRCYGSFFTGPIKCSFCENKGYTVKLKKSARDYNPREKALKGKTQKLPCPQCMTHGKVCATYGRFHGHRYEPSCNHKKKSCDKCKGQGFRVYQNPELVKCRQCGGFGKVCGGTQHPMGMCNDKVNCHNCGGIGKVVAKGK